MTNKKTQTRRFLTAWLLALVVAVTLLGNASTVYAASVKKISSYHSKLVCGATATIKGMTGTNYKYTSSNKKVATINKSGKIKALRLGVTNITVKKGNTKKEYELTVIPKKASDIRVSRNIFLYGEKTKIKIVSDKYDTSQIKPEFFSSFEELSENGKWDGTADEEYECSQGGIGYFYGSFEGEAILYVISPESLCNNLSYGINAGEEHENKIKLSNWDEESPTFLPSEFLENGIIHCVSLPICINNDTNTCEKLCVIYKVLQRRELWHTVCLYKSVKSIFGKHSPVQTGDAGI